MRYLREHGDSTWREIAGGVLDETMTLREVAGSTVYRDQLVAGAQALVEHRHEVGDAVFEEEGRQTAQVLDELREQIRLEGR
jgi:hypothetical protein